MTLKPTILNSEQTTDSCELTLHLPDDLMYFQGHFPEKPILAGVVQLQWAVTFAKQYLSLDDLPVNSVEVLKFQQFIEPNSEIVLSMSQKSSDKFVFSFTSVAGRHASGRVKLGQAS
jgi:3-hydroxymyristoyl/3-hydroxydecanoyl-(acyl carrier protein) dehydratase